jgi:hypothetical protein
MRMRERRQERRQGILANGDWLGLGKTGIAMRISIFVWRLERTARPMQMVLVFLF